MAADWIPALAQSTFAPRRVETALQRLNSAWMERGREPEQLERAIESFPMGKSVIAKLLASSAISAEKLIYAPEILDWLSEPEISVTNRLPWQMQVDLARLRADEKNGFDRDFRYLRRFKTREMLRIALREIAQAAPLEQTALELSCLADLCVQEVLAGWDTALRAELGDPDSHLCILGMGKLGGKELNYSSDIDLIFAYSEEGSLNPNFTYHQFFNRLGEHIVRTFSETHPEGSLFRVDMRLRPEGDSGPLTRSVDSMENYYSGYGETWERMAMAKARCIAGDEALGYEILQRLQPFVYPRYVTPEMIEEIAHTKGRLEREVAGIKNRHRDLKNGYGGIREIEFVVQSLQLLHGAHHPFLQQPSTLKALDTLSSTGVEGLTHEDTLTLRAAYRFLRTAEHRIQIEAERQTHTLPADEDAMRRLASSLDYESVGAFESHLQEVREGVRKIYDAHFQAERPAAVLEFEGFRDPERAVQLFDELRGAGPKGGLAPRTRRIFAQLEPSLLKELKLAAEPDLVLNQLSRFVKAYGTSGALYELLLQYPRLLELYRGIFDASPVLGELAIKHPDLVESVARERDLDEELTVERYLERERSGYAAASAKGVDEKDWLREFRRFEWFRILLRDVMKVTKLDGILREYTALAEACLIQVLNSLGVADSVTVIAMGKFGARELSFGSDLDLVFIGQDTSAAQAVLREYGRISPLGGIDEIDTRLRPEGENGPLVHSINGYHQYFSSGRAQFWEAQALSKARPVSGPESDAFLTMAKEEWSRFGRATDLMEQVGAMLERVHAERSHEDGFNDFKTGRGGMMALEFAVQAQQMRHQIWAPNTLEAAARLRDARHWTEEQRARLEACYRFLRRVSFVLRRYHIKSRSRLPENAQELEGLACRLGYENVESFLNHYRVVRNEGEQVVMSLLEMTR